MTRRKPAPSAAPLAHQKPTRPARLKLDREERLSLLLLRGELRHDVIIRAGRRCEWCLSPVPPGELHHVLGGSGRRREHERLDTLAFVCIPCHHGWHRSDGDVLSWAMQWTYRSEAKGLDFTDARTEIQRRLDKLTTAKWNVLREQGRMAR